MGDGRGLAWPELSEMLRERSGDRVREALQQAHTIGPSAAAAISQLHGARPRAERGRLIGALAAALGAGNEDRLVEAVSESNSTTQERLMALLAIALGPRCRTSLPGLAAWRDERPPAAERVALCLALSRCGEPPAVDWFGTGLRQDPGVLAAALIAGVRPPAAVLERWTAVEDAEVDERHWLVWRGLLAAPAAAGLASWQAAVGRRALATAADSAADLRAAAAAWVARNPSALDTRPQAALLRVIAGSAAGRARAQELGALVAVPSSRFELELRRALAVQFALAAPLPALQVAAVEWRQAPELSGDVCLALALRCLIRAADRAAIGALCIGGPLDRVEEAWWVSVIVGAATSSEPPAGLPPVLAATAALALEGRAGEESIGRQLELELWQRGTHPGRALYAVHAVLVRDLLVTGSIYVEKRLGRVRSFDYLPPGLERGDRTLFEPLYEFFEWRADLGLVPAEYALAPRSG